jgi:hypothetical protein
MKQTYEVTAWRPETYTTSGEFEAESAAEALLMAKEAFQEHDGESCLTCTGWDEFRVALHGKEVLELLPVPEREAELLVALNRLLDALGGLPVTILTGPMYDALHEANRLTGRQNGRAA